MTPAPTPEAAELADWLTALAERCEQAPGPDRELDGLIQRAMGADYPVRYSSVGVCNAFTASLDVASGLIPPEHDLLLMQGHGEQATAATPHHLAAKTDERQAATPALAICAAALRARAALLLKDQSHG